MHQNVFNRRPFCMAKQKVANGVHINLCVTVWVCLCVWVCVSLFKSVCWSLCLSAGQPNFRFFLSIAHNCKAHTKLHELRLCVPAYLSLCVCMCVSEWVCVCACLCVTELEHMRSRPTAVQCTRTAVSHTHAHTLIKMALTASVWLSVFLFDSRLVNVLWVVLCSYLTFS